MSRLDEIEARLEGATPGPWAVSHDDESVFNDTCVVQGDYGWIASGPHHQGPAYDEDTDQGRADAELIGHALVDLTDLLDVVRALDGYVTVLGDGEPMNADDVGVLRDMVRGLEER